MVLGFVLLHCKNGTEDEVVSQLKNEKEVEEILQTFGPYDTIVKLNCKNNDELRSIIYHKIRRISNIESTVSLTSSDSS